MLINELNQIKKDGEELGSKVKRLDSVIAELTRLRGLESSGLWRSSTASLTTGSLLPMRYARCLLI